MKARKPAATSPDNGFYFDPTEPLRLIDPVKRKPEEQILIAKASEAALA
jgi:hypothetical protein